MPFKLVVKVPPLPTFAVEKGVAPLRISVGLEAPNVIIAMELPLAYVVGVTVPPTVTVPLVAVKVLLL